MDRAARALLSPHGSCMAFSLQGRRQAPRRNRSVVETGNSLILLGVTAVGLHEHNDSIRPVSVTTGSGLNGSGSGHQTGLS
jgi:hypothetical protein